MKEKIKRALMYAASAPFYLLFLVLAFLAIATLHIADWIDQKGIFRNRIKSPL